MNLTDLVVRSVKDVFSVVEPMLGTGQEGKILGTNPKGDESYQIDKVAEEAYLKAREQAEKASEEAIAEAMRVRDETIVKAWSVREDSVEKAWAIYSRVIR